jgi:uncharacterized DUF497 family protein
MDFPSRLGIPVHEFRVVFGTTKIDYDPDKDHVNRHKHRYLLESAVYLLERLVHPAGSGKPYLVSDGFLENGEVRHMHMSTDDGGKVVLMVTTMRPDETVRVISFRRAHESERATFKQLTGYAEP